MSKIVASQKVQCPDPYIYQNSLHVYDFRQICKIPLFSSLSPLKRPYTGPIAINIYLTLTPYRSDLNAKFLPTTESGMVEEDG